MRGAGRILGALLLLAATTASPLLADGAAQNLGKGFQADKVYEFGDLDHVNLFNGVLNIVLPIGQSYRVSSTLSYRLVLTYSGNNWDTETNDYDSTDPLGRPITITKGYAMPVDSATTQEPWTGGLGWRLSFGQLEPPTLCTDCWAYHGPDGSRHQFTSQLHGGTSEATSDHVWYTNDGTYLRMVWVTTTVMNPDGSTTVSDTDFHDVEFPDGTVHRFSRTTGNLLEMRDRFGNKVSLSYGTMGDGSPKWTITDGIRTHTVEFERIVTTADPSTLEPSFYDVVKSVKLAAFGGTTALYTFHYGGQTGNAADVKSTISRRFTLSQDCSVPPTVDVALLTSVDRPDGSSFTMTYDQGDNANYTDTLTDPQNPVTNVCTRQTWEKIFGYSGNLTALGLPTRGSIEWSYSNFIFPPESITSGAGVNPTGRLIGQNVGTHSAGVGERREKDASGCIVTKRTYQQQYYKITTTATAHTSVTTVSALTGFACDGSGATVDSKTLHYFSVAPVSNATSCALAGEYGMAFTRDCITTDGVVPSGLSNPDPNDATRFLAEVTFDSGNAVQRYQYAGYECDASQCLEDGNRRQRSQRMVFEDGKSRWSNSSDFDGLGHYRTVVADGDFADGGVSRTTITAYNKTDTAVGGNSLNVGTYDPANPGTGFTMPSFTTTWVLGTYTSQSVTENSVTAKALTCFDQTTGFLQRKRVLTGASAGSTDLLSRFTSENVAGADSGNVAREDSFGGDGSDQVLGTTALCTMGVPASPGYRVDHTYQNGALATSRYFDPGANQALSFYSTDQTIDASTGLASSSRDSAGLATTYHYDTSSRLDTLTPPGSEGATTHAHPVATASSPAKVHISRVDALNTDGSIQDAVEAEFQFDGLGRPTSELRKMPDGTWATRTTLYDALGRKSRVSEMEATPTHYTSFVYDLFGRATRVTAPDNHQTTFSYAGLSSMMRNVTVRTSAQGESSEATTETYDRHGRLVSVAEYSNPDPNAGAVTTSYTYDVGNRLSGVSTSGGTTTQTRSFTYDNRGFLTSETSPEKSGAVTYTFDARGHATRAVDGPFDLSYGYDPAERLTSVQETGGAQRALKSFTFATANVPANCITGTCNAANGKLSTATRNHYDDAVTGGVSVAEAYQYSEVGGRVSQRDTTVSTTSAFAGATFNTTQHYNTLGLVSSVGYPVCSVPSQCTAFGGRNSNYGYTNGWMTSVTSGTSTYASMTYQPSGLIDTITHGNNVSEQWIGDPNGMARPCAIFATGGGTTLQNATPGNGTCGKVISSGAGIAWTTGQYAYDGAGNVTQVGTKKYLYDAVSRLTAESDGYSNTSGSFSLLNTYSYDAFGNMTNRTNGQSFLCSADFCDGSSQYSTTAINVDPRTNRLFSPNTYDGAGNLTSHPTKRVTQSYAWDPVGTMRSLSDTSGRNVHYLYTADDERIAVVTPTGSHNQTSWALRGFSNQLLRKFSDDSFTGTRVWTWTEDEIWRGSSLVANESPNGGTKHYVLDHLGSPRLVTGANATWLGTNEFSAFGMGGTGGSGALQFTSHERDWGPDSEQTIDYMHARFYGAQGRFLSVDRHGGSLTVPQSWNRYAYTMDNPLKRVDADGNVAVTVTGGSNPDGEGSPMYNLAGRLNGRGDLGAVRGFGNNNIPAAVSFISSEFKKNPSQPVVLIGHSWGGAAAIAIAQDLQKLKIPVTQLITLDVAPSGNPFGGGHNLTIPTNVASAVNFFQTNGPLGNNRLVAESSVSSVQNILVPNTTHTDIDDLLWTALAHALLQIYAGAPGIRQPHLGITMNPPASSDPTGTWQVYRDGIPVN